MDDKQAYRLYLHPFRPFEAKNNLLAIPFLTFQALRSLNDSRSFGLQLIRPFISNKRLPVKITLIKPSERFPSSILSKSTWSSNRFEIVKNESTNDD